MNNHYTKMIELIKSTNFNRDIKISNLYTLEDQNKIYKFLRRSHELLNKDEESGYIHNPFAFIQLHSNFYLVFSHQVRKYMEEVYLEIFPIYKFIDEDITLCDSFITTGIVNDFNKYRSYNNFLDPKHFFQEAFNLGCDPYIELNYCILDLPLREILDLSFNEGTELKEDIEKIFRIYLETDNNNKDLVYKIIK